MEIVDVLSEWQLGDAELADLRPPVGEHLRNNVDDESEDPVLVPLLCQHLVSGSRQ
jgi:hypothetical protein